MKSLNLTTLNVQEMNAKEMRDSNGGSMDNPTIEIMGMVTDIILLPWKIIFLPFTAVGAVVRGTASVVSKIADAL